MGLVGEEHGACGVAYTDQENRSSFKMLTYNNHKPKTGNESFIKWNGDCTGKPYNADSFKSEKEICAYI